MPAKALGFRPEDVFVASTGVIGKPLPMERIDAATERQIKNTLELARQLEGIPMEFKGSGVASTIAAFVKEYGITHIVLGRSQRRWYRRLFGQSVLDRLLRTVKGVDVVVVDTE